MFYTATEPFTSFAFYSLTEVISSCTSAHPPHDNRWQLTSYTSNMIIRKIAALVLHLCLLPSYLCVPFNVSIDDTFGDERTGKQITFTPSNGWKQGQTCTDCTANVDANQPFRHSWHDATFLPQNMGGDGIIRSASVSFNGMSHSRSRSPLSRLLRVTSMR